MSTPTPLELTPQERDQAIHSLKRFFSEAMDEELSELRARLLLEYIAQELLPIGYNRGVQDAEEFFRKRLEDLPATCFEPAFTYWQAKRTK